MSCDSCLKFRNKIFFPNRVIRTIKNNIYKYLSETEQFKYINRLQEIVDTCNISEHKELLNNINLPNNSTDILSFSKKMYKYNNSDFETA